MGRAQNFRGLIAAALIALLAIMFGCEPTPVSTPLPPKQRAIPTVHRQDRRPAVPPIPEAKPPPSIDEQLAAIKSELRARRQQEEFREDYPP